VTFTGWSIFWALVVLIAACVFSYVSGLRKGENKAIRDIDHMEERPLKQRLDDYRRAKKKPSSQNQNRTKKPSSQNRSKKT
jgi:hypothetical protein